MKLDENGYSLIMAFEGLRLKPYYDIAGIATIGYGNTFYPNGQSVKINDKPITIEKAVEIFKNVSDKFAVIVDHFIKVPVNQNQFNALVSLCYNIGTTNFKNSTILKKINIQADNKTIGKEFIRWSYALGYYSNGLNARRKKEFYHYCFGK
ncbi:lysozyme [Flavobacterium psychrophilum]